MGYSPGKLQHPNEHFAVASSCYAPRSTDKMCIRVGGGTHLVYRTLSITQKCDADFVQLCNGVTRVPFKRIRFLFLRSKNGTEKLNSPMVMWPKFQTTMQLHQLHIRDVRPCTLHTPLRYKSYIPAIRHHSTTGIIMVEGRS